MGLYTALKEISLIKNGKVYEALRIIKNLGFNFQLQYLLQTSLFKSSIKAYLRQEHELIMMYILLKSIVGES